MMISKREKFEKAKRCIRLLEDLYGIPEAEAIDPVDLLVETILSQNTSDVNSLKAFGRLKSAYHNYNELLSAPVSEISRHIRIGGLSDVKAQRILGALHRIKGDAGSIGLGFLKGMDKDAAREYLLSIPGVGPKTASVVLLFAFGLPFMPVDTHVYRVSRRLGLVPEKASIDKAQGILEEITPPEKYLSLHLNLIRHGRLICRARDPRHEQCSLRPICDYYLRATSLK
jgi:endonuclease-3